jgi:hypothetical protein
LTTSGGVGTLMNQERNRFDDSERRLAMKKNRKKADTYRFNGHPFLHPDSIHSVTMADLESRIKEFEAKLADPNDPDDKKWTARWLSRFQEEYDKKRVGRSLKQRDKQTRRRVRLRADNRQVL